MSIYTKTRFIASAAITVLVLGCSETPEQAEPQAQEANGTATAEGEAKPAEQPKADAAPEQTAPAASAKYESPEAVFAAAKAAVEAKDYQALIGCIEPSARREMAVGMYMVLGFVVVADKSLKPDVEALVEKYKLPDKKAMKKIKGNQKAKIKKLGEMIEDPAAFIGDAMTLFDKAAENQATKKKKSRMTSPGNSIAVGELVGLKIKGDKAKAKMKPEKGKAKKIAFAKVEDSWYLVPKLK